MKITKKTKTKQKQNKMKTKIPTTVVTSVTDYVNNNFDYTPNQKQKLIKILAELWLFIYNKETCYKNTLQHSYVRINSSELLKFKLNISKCNICYAKLIDMLQAVNLIIVNESYEVGKFSKGYKTTKDFSTFTDLDIDINKVFNTKIKSKKFYLKQFPEHNKLINDAYQFKIKIEDYLAWMQLNKGLTVREETKRFNKSTNKVQTVKAEILDDEKIYEFLIDALRINIESLWFAVSSTGRFYNSFSNLSTTVLPFITAKSKNKLVEIDAANAQPLMLTTIIEDDKFKKSCENGKYYDDIAYANKLERKQVKSNMFTIFFEDRHITKKNRELIESAFPGLTDKINALKSPKVHGVQMKQDNELLWFKLQSIESSIFVKTALATKTPVLVRHDSIIIDQKFIDQLEKELREEFAKIGLNATLKINQL